MQDFHVRGQDARHFSSLSPISSIQPDSTGGSIHAQDAATGELRGSFLDAQGAAVTTVTSLPLAWRHPWTRSHRFRRQVRTRLAAGGVFGTGRGGGHVETQCTVVSAMIDERAIADLPMNGRRYPDLSLLAPGCRKIPGVA